MMGLEVTHDLETLKEKMFRFLPTEKIRIESAQGAIVLSGEVSSVQKLDAALRLAETYASNNSAQVGIAGAPQPNVLNLLQVGGAQQVLLEVKVAEISRTFLKRMDVRFTGLFNDGTFRMGLVSRSVDTDGDNGISVDQTFTDRAAFANYLSGNFFFNLLIDAAREQGLARILAEPNLTALSGQEAKFLAGGEFPIPVAQGDDAVGVQFKEFGIGLVFVPIVLDSGLVSLKVNVSVSELSNEGSTVISVPGSNSFFPVPSLITRAANSSVEVPSGQTIAIAGLINERLREGVSKFPGLGDVPVLGTLFTSQDYQKNQTELVIFVTPRLARPT
jgi:pilus assembly protein CpaC